jgi:hypothetical protein
MAPERAQARDAPSSAAADRLARGAHGAAIGLQHTPALGYNRRLMKLKTGSRLRSAVCDTQVMVIAAPEKDLLLACGGAPLLPLDAEPPPGATPDPAAAQGTQIGKRYVNEAGDLELLCTKPGAGSLTVDGMPLALKGAKPLPSSD